MKLDKNEIEGFAVVVLLFFLFVLVIIGMTKCVRSCSEPDPYENDEWYNQSVGRQILMEKYGMKEEAKREREIRREYMRQNRR